jgi:alkylation response protein AidB-like acyl-CoA dehydrogenase
VVGPAERERVDDVARQPQPPGRVHVDLTAQRGNDVHLGIRGQPHQVLDRAELTDLAAVTQGRERPPAGNAVDHALGNQVVEGAPDGLAVKVEAAHQMMIMAARKKDSGQRGDLEAGMAKYLAAEYCRDVVEDSFRIHGGYGFSKEHEIERLYREAPMLLIGEGTSDILKMIIGRRILEDYRLR